jgi:hypothetical protein
MYCSKCGRELKTTIIKLKDSRHKLFIDYFNTKTGKENTTTHHECPKKNIFNEHDSFDKMNGEQLEEYYK